MVPEDFKLYFYLNPMTGIVELWRALFMEGLVLWRWLAISAVYATLSLLGGSILYQRLKGKFAEAL
jgi:lipopolysaccharide transport system permease protein